MVALAPQQEELCRQDRWDFSDLRALYVNCTSTTCARSICSTTPASTPAGPGPSYLDPGSGGPANDFTNRNTTFMTWNLLRLARMLQDAGGVPAHGNQRSAWDAGCRFDLPNPEHR